MDAAKIEPDAELLLRADGTERYARVGSVLIRTVVFCVESPIVVTFANAGANAASNENLEEFLPWSFDFLRKKRINTISLACIGKDNWYLDSKLGLFFETIRPGLEDFPERLGYGGSMGGFAAAAWGNLLGLDRCLLLNPISSLAASRVPWEYRFHEASILFDEANFLDAATYRGKGFIVFDPLFRPDAFHAKRISPSMVRLYIPGVGHRIPIWLSELGLLKSLFFEFYSGDVDTKKFYKMVRNRRFLKRYREFLLSGEAWCVNPKRFFKLFESFRFIKKQKFSFISFSLGFVKLSVFRFKTRLKMKLRGRDFRW